MNFSQIKLFKQDGSPAGEIQGNRHSVRGPGQILSCLNKSYEAINPKKKIVSITNSELENLQTSFSGKVKKDKQNVPKDFRGRYEALFSQQGTVKPSDLLKKAGIQVKNDKCLCPFHEDQNPSMSVNDTKGLVYCFACSEGYNSITLYRALKEKGLL